MRTYAMSDIHGCSDALIRAINWMLRDSTSPSDRAVFLGDYVDRGPDPADVVAILRDFEHTSDMEPVVLAGNHEQMMVMAFKGGFDAINCWLGNGGVQTLQSYGMSLQDFQDWYRDGLQFERLPKDLREDLSWMMNLSIRSEDEHRYYVHAGLQPGRSWEEQTIDDALWYRKPKDEPEIQWPKQVVHGHTPVKGGPFVHPYRINIDTGACFKNGRLTVARFTDDNPEPHFEFFTESGQ